MLKLSKKTEYALMAARYIASQKVGTSVSAKEIAANHNISYELVSKVLQNLAKWDLIESFQGAKGGYSLKRSAFDISLIDLIKAVEPNYQITSCLSNDTSSKDCEHYDCCKIKDPLAVVQKKIDKVFQETKLSQIL